jgi:hypothetical protein
MRAPKNGLISRSNLGARGRCPGRCSSGCVDHNFLDARTTARLSSSCRILCGNETVIFAFESKSLRDVCQDESRALAELDAEVAEALKHRLADLAAATTGKDIIAGRPSTFGLAGECMSVDLGTDRKLVFVANHVKKPLGANKRVDWSKVTRIKLLGIQNANA